MYFQPAMNQRMWNSPATRRTIELLTADGHHLLGSAPTSTLTEAKELTALRRYTG